MRPYSTPDQLSDALLRLPHTAGRPCGLVGVDGRGGSGKSAIAAWIARTLPDVEIVHVDDFYRPSTERSAPPAGVKPVGWDFDWSRLEHEVLIPLGAGLPACFRIYDWGLDALGERREIRRSGVVVVEGVTALRREIAGCYALTVWVECTRGLRLARGLKRDGEDARSVWEEEWMPEEDRYVAAHRPDERADFVVHGSAFLDGRS